MLKHFGDDVASWGATPAFITGDFNIQVAESLHIQSLLRTKLFVDAKDWGIPAEQIKNTSHKQKGSRIDLCLANQSGSMLLKNYNKVCGGKSVRVALAPDHLILAQERDAWNQVIQQTYPTLVPDSHRTRSQPGHYQLVAHKYPHSCLLTQTGNATATWSQTQPPACFSAQHTHSNFPGSPSFEHIIMQNIR